MSEALHMKHKVIDGWSHHVLLIGCAVYCIIIGIACGPDAFVYGSITSFLMLVSTEFAFRASRPGEQLLLSNIECIVLLMATLPVLSIHIPWFTVAIR